MILLSLFFGLAFSQSESALTDSAFWELKTPVIEEIIESPMVVLRQSAFGEDCEKSSQRVVGVFSEDFSPMGEEVIIFDQIVNLGKKVWTILENGRSSFETTTMSANALPGGLKCWLDLEGWKVPKSRLFRITIENALGMKVIDYTYRVGFTYGGTLGGVGQYITNASIQTANVDLIWGGFKFASSATVPSVFNASTKKNPLAAMELLIQWKASSPIKSIEGSSHYYLNGRGDFLVLD